MKRILTGILCGALLVVPARGAEQEATQGGLTLTAASAVLMEKESGTLLYEKEAHTQLAPASVTKVMTLLLIMEALEAGQFTLEDPVAVSQAAAGMGGSQVYLEAGEEMAAEELIKCIAVASANDAAVAMAEFLAGSEGAFVEEMNLRASELGMADTRFLNCTGLPAEGHVTSAYDIALMSRELILNHPQIRDYTTVWMDSIRNGAFGLTNTNRLIRFYSGATGLKTGSTDEALYCMSATAERDGMELIAVVMRSPTSADRFTDAQTLLDYGFARYQLLTVYPDGALPPVEVLLGERAQIQPELSEECRLLVEKGEAGQVTTQVNLASDVAAPVEPGQILGTFQVLVDGVVRREIPIVTREGVERLRFGGIFARLFRELVMAG